MYLLFVPFVNLANLFWGDLFSKTPKKTKNSRLVGLMEPVFKWAVIVGPVYAYLLLLLLFCIGLVLVVYFSITAAEYHIIV